MTNSPLDSKKRFISWPVVALMDFVTVIGFDDLIYNFHNQGLAIVTTWIIMILLFVWPYEMMVGQLGGTFNEDGGGLASWVRATNGDLAGYVVAFFYWIAGLPYVVDVANSVVVSISWLVKGNGNLQNYMPTIVFALFTAIVFLVFIWFQHFFKNRSLEVLSTIGGIAMFVMTILFVVMTVAALIKGRHIATQPFNLHSFIPNLSGGTNLWHFLSTFGLLIFAINGAELAAPYVKEMKNGKKDFPKAMMMLLIMTIFLTVFGSFSLAVFFNAHNLPYDLKMNGSYYAFQALGREFGIGNTFMYTFAVSQAVYMFAQLAVILDASTRIFLSDVALKYLPKSLGKLNDDGLPINGYWLTTGIVSLVLFLSNWLPSINDMFNWLLNINGIVSPFVTSFVFFAFMRIRQRSKDFPSAYVFIKNDKLAWLVGAWCFVITIVFSILGIFPTDAKAGTMLYDKELILNIVIPVIFVALSVLLPYLAWVERNALQKALRRALPFAVIAFGIGAYIVIRNGLNDQIWIALGAWVVVVAISVLIYWMAFGLFRKHQTR
ncbi:APC family permease [Pediococcus claussenii]|uniref:Amino acid transporter n=1 Tax=Pediococcus claussenii (strain ATCC BAA-344 / DSM 14800 / JCM 18046 / KCTC 3811 / LMG 21948 / P06) TaxID=701521 RepID=G8PEH9_PEDCP|nr:amino acid permease [Pediococcus claussenii]AEV95588.1 amino acid transporter [Pediococcus claussenii ATCC BAA-344]ANZ69109.1 amino acid permease [Pediococcus claussenii]ANZ70926.1 amino acid permease [Pediococcus claussenii]